MSLSMRLGTVFTPDEYVQARGDIDIHTNDHKVIYASGLADVVKNNTVYCIKFISSLAHKHERKGTAPYQHEVCAGNDEADYSDIFCTESDVIAHEIIR